MSLDAMLSISHGTELCLKDTPFQIECCRNGGRFLRHLHLDVRQIFGYEF